MRALYNVYIMCGVTVVKEKKLALKTLDTKLSQSDLLDLILSMRRVTESPWIADFGCWIFLEVAILGADQKERGRHQPVSFPTKATPVYPEDLSNILLNEICQILLWSPLLYLNLCNDLVSNPKELGHNSIDPIQTELKNDCACVTCDPVRGKISTQATNS